MHHYKNEESKLRLDGTKIIRKVHIKGKKGHKSETHYKGGKKIFSAKKTLKNSEITLIKIGKFIPGLFKDCGCKTRKRKG